jgi:hypothetical protein
LLLATVSCHAPCCASPQVNEFVKRVRAFRIHLLIMGHLRKNMPAMFGKDKAQRKMLERLPDIFFQVRSQLANM